MKIRQYHDGRGREDSFAGDAEQVEAARLAKQDQR